MTDRLAEALSDAVGAGHVLTDPALLASFEVDWTRRFRGRARLAVRPGSTDEVAAVLRACAGVGAAVVPQGGNTGLVGGGVPRAGEVVLLTSRLDRLEPVDVGAGQVTVGAGATLEAVQRHAAASGWDVGIDLAARASATVGGMVATNAGGVHVLRHGTMRQRLAGLEVVLADGSVVRRTAGLAKDAAGYDLPGLLCGSEGTLGVVTAAVLRLAPLPVARVTAALAVASAADALDVFGHLRARLPGLEAAEVCWRDGLDLVRSELGVPGPFEPAPPCLLVVEVGAWSERAAAALLDEVGEAVAACPAVADSAVATEPSARARLWEARERHTEAISATGIPHKLDVAVPLSALARFEEEVRAEVADRFPGARCVLFGHLGDGNLHVNVVGPEPADDAVDEAVLRLVAAHRGTISAEHGIGVAKVRWLALCRGPGDIAAMRAVKAALDPSGLLNPGVLLG